MEKAALLSVSDRTGLVEFAQGLQKIGYTLLGTSGTKIFLLEHGVECTAIEDYTGQKEILDGRVKTLHPKIHAGLLAKRSDSGHMAQLTEEGILPIEVAVVNLYPFTQNLTSESANDPAKMIELIDIGGPTMIRAAAKNWESVYPVIDPTDYSSVLERISQGSIEDQESKSLRLNLSVKVFSALADYNLNVAEYFAGVEVGSEDGALRVSEQESGEQPFSGISGHILRRAQTLRYGENPHQKAALYCQVGSSEKPWEQFGGKELSYNNLLDFDAARRLIQSMPREVHSAVIIKHLNPCGAAVASSLTEALSLAKRCDPRSHFGGIIGLNRCVDKATAENITSEFSEIVLAPEYEADALDVLRKKKNLRILKVDLEKVHRTEFRSIGGGVLIQDSDLTVSSVREAELVGGPSLSDSDLDDLQLAWNICAHVKSNAITLVVGGKLVSVGAGQMSRIDSVQLALSKAQTHGHDLKGAVCASDAFFPFTDGIETLAEAGVKAVIVPKGAKKDAEVAARAGELGVSLLFAVDRHFRH